MSETIHIREATEGDAVPEECVEQLSLSNTRNNWSHCGIVHWVGHPPEYLSPDRGIAAKDIL